MSKQTIFRPIIMKCPSGSIDYEEKCFWCREQWRECQNCLCSFKARVLSCLQKCDEESQQIFIDELQIANEVVSPSYEYLFKESFVLDDRQKQDQQKPKKQK